MRRRVECIAGVAPPPRAAWLRALCLERERLANHLGDLGALGNDGGFAFGLAQFSRLREDVLRINDAAFGHRLLMDVVVPGGVARDIAFEHVHAMRDEADRVAREIVALREIYDEHAGTAGPLPHLRARNTRARDEARACSVLPAARAARARPALRFPCAPYDALQVRIASETRGRRMGARRRALRRGARIGAADRIDHRRAARPGRERRIARRSPTSPPTGLAIGYIEGWRGPVLVALESGPNGTIRRCHPQDPSWCNWPVIEHAVIGNIVPDFPLINKSFNLSYSGHDL